MVLDIGTTTGSVAGEIIARVTTEIGDTVKVSSQRVCSPDYAAPTSIALMSDYYPGSSEICLTIGKMIGIDIDTTPLSVKGNGHTMSRARGFRDLFKWEP